MHAKKQRQVELAMRRGLGQGHFDLFYQPIVCARSGRLAKLEALLRWNQPCPGYESPAQFIPLAEQSDLIVDVGIWVTHTCMKQVASWQAMGISVPVISINVSARQLERPGFSSMLRTVARQYAVDPGSIELELTESVLADESASFRNLLAEIRSMGFGLALDDFGTGYSSLSYLQRYHFTSLKVDKSFVWALGKDRRSEALAGAIIHMGHQLDLKVVAEGVETEIQRDFLRAAGCDFLQGFLLGRPAPAIGYSQGLSHAAKAA